MLKWLAYPVSLVKSDPENREHAEESEEARDFRCLPENVSTHNHTELLFLPLFPDWHFISRATVNQSDPSNGLLLAFPQAKDFFVTGIILHINQRYFKFKDIDSHISK